MGIGQYSEREHRAWQRRTRWASDDIPIAPPTSRRVPRQYLATLAAMREGVYDLADADWEGAPYATAARLRAQARTDGMSEREAADYAEWKARQHGISLVRAERKAHWEDGFPADLREYYRQIRP